MSMDAEATRQQCLANIANGELRRRAREAIEGGPTVRHRPSSALIEFRSAWRSGDDAEGDLVMLNITDIACISEGHTGQFGELTPSVIVLRSGHSIRTKKVDCAIIREILRNL